MIDSPRIGAGRGWAGVEQDRASLRVTCRRVATVLEPAVHRVLDCPPLPRAHVLAALVHAGAIPSSPRHLVAIRAALVARGFCASSLALLNLASDRA